MSDDMAAAPLTKAALNRHIRQLGAFDVRVADSRAGFGHAIPQRHPLAVMNECRSAIVFIVPKPAWANNTVIGLPCDKECESAGDDLPLLHRLTRLPGYQTLSIGDLLHDRIWFAAAQLLQQHGYRAGHGAVQEKLCCHEAGIGIYGRSGLIIHPVLGNRFYPGVILTDAAFEPDDRLAGYEPCANCANCGSCVDACPGNAYHAGGSYPGNWSRTTCLETRGRLAAEGIYCHECWRVCPAGTMTEDSALVRRSVTSYGTR